MAYSGSQTDICNYALISELGNTAIGSINDKTESAIKLKAIYDTVRQKELRRNTWKFALTRSLIASVSPPKTVLPNGIPPPYAYAYQMPSNCLRLIDFAGMRQNLGMINYRTGLEKFYDWQGNFIFTNLGTGTTWSSPPPTTATSQWIHYIQDVTDTTQFDPNFAVAFACSLARAVCRAITGSTQLMAMIKSDYNEAINQAAMLNEVERMPEGVADDSFVLSRL